MLGHTLKTMEFDDFAVLQNKIIYKLLIHYYQIICLSITYN